MAQIWVTWLEHLHFPQIRWRLFSNFHITLFQILTAVEYPAWAALWTDHPRFRVPHHQRVCQSPGVTPPLTVPPTYSRYSLVGSTVKPVLRSHWHERSPVLKDHVPGRMSQHFNNTIKPVTKDHLSWALFFMANEVVFEDKFYCSTDIWLTHTLQRRPPLGLFWASLM